MTTGIGIIGTGKHGERYLRHVADVPGLRLAALCRRDRARGEAQARAFGCRFHAEPEALLADRDVDAAILVLPPTVNERVAIAAARAGKALLIEKPLAPTLAACGAIAAAVAAAGVPAMVAHTLRFNAVVAALAAARATVGPLHAAVLTQRFEPSALGWLDRAAEAGGGIILHTGVHSFDLLRHLTGREAVRVTASAARVVTRETEDDFGALIEMAPAAAGGDPILAMVGGSRATAGRSGAIELAGRDGQLVGDHVHGTAARLVGTRSEPLPVGAAVPTVLATLQELAAVLAARRPPAITLADGAAAVAIAEACYRSIAERRTVAVERLA
jgi:predicted dehydrogenase